MSQQLSIFSALVLLAVLGLLSSLVLAVVVVKLLRARRKKGDSIVAQELKRMYDIQLRVQSAFEEKKNSLKLSLQCMQDEILDFCFSLQGTTLTSYKVSVEFHLDLGWPMPELVLPEAYRPFEVEAQALSRALTGIESQIDTGRVEHDDLVFYQSWVKELKDRFMQFVCENNRTADRLRVRLEAMCEVHADLAKGHDPASVNTAFQRFPGMIGVLEILVDEMPAAQLKPYVDSAASQIWKLQSLTVPCSSSL